MMHKLLPIFAVVGLLTFATSCGSPRVVVINSASDVVRLGPGVKGKVYIWRNGEWQLTQRVTLPEGWYAGPGPQ